MYSTDSGRAYILIDIMLNDVRNYYAFESTLKFLHLAIQRIYGILLKITRLVKFFFKKNVFRYTSMISHVKPLMMYDLECWALNKREETKMGVREMRMLT